MTPDRFDAFDIVVVPFPYADRLAEKRRPALVISSRKLAPFGLIWLAMITSAQRALVMRRCDSRPRPRRPARAIRGAAGEDRLHRAVADRPPRRTPRQGDRKRSGAEVEGIFGRSATLTN